MDYFIQQLINGITIGAIYGLIAVGYTMVFGIIGMVNFAHGDVFMLSGFIALIFYLMLTQIFGLTDLWLILPVVLAGSMALTALWSFTISQVAYKPLAGSFRLAPLISAIGMSIFLANFVQLVQGPRNKPVPGILNQSFPIFGTAEPGRFQVVISVKQLLIWLVTALVLAIFWYVVAKTPLGRAQRATEQDRKMAALLGIDTNKTIALTFVIGAALAAVAGTMNMVYYGVVAYNDGFLPGIKAFTAAVLGGIGSLPGAVLGGLLIGLIETMWGAYVGSDYKDVAAFAVLIGVLIFMPQGLLGRPDVEKV